MSGSIEYTLVADLGNTDLVWAVFDGKQPIMTRRFSSASITDEAELLRRFTDFLLEYDLPVTGISRAVAGSVVPAKTPVLAAVLEALTGKPPLLAGPELYKKLPVKIEKPYEIGADLVANALVAHITFKQACLVIDFGTALTFTGIDENGYIAGVSIAPGLKTAVGALQQRTAQLPDIPLVYPASVLGRNTQDAMAAGVMIGYEGLVLHMIARFRQELSPELKVIATGGMSAVIPSLSAHGIELIPDLTLHGLYTMLKYR